MNTRELNPRSTTYNYSVSAVWQAIRLRGAAVLGCGPDWPEWVVSVNRGFSLYAYLVSIHMSVLDWRKDAEQLLSLSSSKYVPT